jgi:Schlafen, AlbA_2
MASDGGCNFMGDTDIINSERVSPRDRSVLVHAVLGAIFGMVILHPLTMVVYSLSLEVHEDSVAAIIASVFRQTFVSFEVSMWLMASIFIVLGLVIGAGSGWYYRAVRKQERLLAIRERELTMSLDSLVLGGENQHVEFKTSVRWDRASESINKALEHAVVKTVAGFMNGGGGILLLGVSDEGVPLGLEPDYATLKKPNRDGYHLHIMHLISDRLGPDLCEFVTVRFQAVEGDDVCILSVSAAARPVYVNAGTLVKYFLRTGNSTRELNTREAVEHVQSRYPEMRRSNSQS